jgi:hypothetical protein
MAAKRGLIVCFDLIISVVEMIIDDIRSIITSDFLTTIVGCLVWGFEEEMESEMTFEGQRR